MTTKQINDWQAFERVRRSGRWNMFSKEAQVSSGLSREEYFFVMQNYEKLLNLQRSTVKNK